MIERGIERERERERDVCIALKTEEKRDREKWRYDREYALPSRYNCMARKHM